jgi:RNA polymerase sigma factor (sigma-70 family)
VKTNSENDANEANFREIVRKYEPRLRAYLRTIAQKNLDIDEIVQDTFVIVWRKFEFIVNSEQDSRLHFSWICGIGSRVIQNAERSNARHINRLQRLGHERSTESPSETLTSEILERLKFEKKIAPLSVEDRMIAVLILWEDANVKEIAAVCNCSDAAAYKKIQRVISKLRQAYEYE